MNKTFHWIFTGLTGVAGMIQSVTAFLPPKAAGVSVIVLALINAVLHTLPADTLSTK